MASFTQLIRRIAEREDSVHFGTCQSTPVGSGRKHLRAVCACGFTSEWSTHYNQWMLDLADHLEIDARFDS